jgi:hypothetical protein
MIPIQLWRGVRYRLTLARRDYSKLAFRRNGYFLLNGASDHCGAFFLMNRRNLALDSVDGIEKDLIIQIGQSIWLHSQMQDVCWRSINGDAAQWDSKHNGRLIRPKTWSQVTFNSEEC